MFAKLGFEEREEMFRGRNLATLEFEFEEAEEAEEDDEDEYRDAAEETAEEAD